MSRVLTPRLRRPPRRFERRLVDTHAFAARFVGARRTQATIAFFVRRVRRGAARRETVARMLRRRVAAAFLAARRRAAFLRAFVRAPLSADFRSTGFSLAARRLRRRRRGASAAIPIVASRALVTRRLRGADVVTFRRVALRFFGLARRGVSRALFAFGRRAFARGSMNRPNLSRLRCLAARDFFRDLPAMGFLFAALVDRRGVSSTAACCPPLRNACILST